MEVFSATVTEHTSNASFMPVSRYVSQCAFVNMEVKFDYGVHKVLLCYYTSEETLSVLTCACNVQYKSYALKIQHDYNKTSIIP